MSINYTEKGAGLHQAIVAAGHWLIERDGVWTSDNDAAVQQIIDAYTGASDAIAALEAKYNSIISAGRLYSVVGGADPSQHTYQIDEVPPFDAAGRPVRRDSQSTITTMGQWAANVVNNVAGTAPWPANFAWRDASNNMVPMTAPQCYAFSQNVATYVAALFANYCALYAQITAATTWAQVSAIDVTKGWPSNP